MGPDTVRQPPRPDGSGDRKEGVTMFTFTAETVVAREPAVVGRFLGDAERFADWTDMREVRVLTEGPLGAGSRVEATIGSGPLRSKAIWELTVFEPERQVSYRVVSAGRLALDGDYRLSGLPDGRTRVTADFTVRTHGILRVLEPLVRGELRSGETRELERMKAILEAEAVPAAGRAAASV
jgi:hypothetical protein